MEKIKLIDYECWAITFPSNSHLDWYAHKVLGFGKSYELGKAIWTAICLEDIGLVDVNINSIIVVGKIDAERIKNIYGEHNLLGDGENLEESGLYKEGEFKRHG